MNLSKFVDTKENYESSSESFNKSLYVGACIKIKNSQKTFQVIGFNPESNLCWIREWPFNLEAKKTFSLAINQITLQTSCSNYFSEI